MEDARVFSEFGKMSGRLEVKGKAEWKPWEPGGMSSEGQGFFVNIREECGSGNDLELI